MPVAEIIPSLIETLAQYGAIGVMIFGCYKIMQNDNKEKKENTDFLKELVNKLIDEKK